MSRPPQSVLIRVLPAKLREILDARSPRDGDNLGLWLDKLLPVEKNDKNDKNNKNKYELKGSVRARELDKLFIPRALGKPRPWHSEAARAALERLRTSCNVVHGPGNWRELRARVCGRLLVDYGRVSTIESSLSFHATLGVPRIAGSALKGLLRAALRDGLPRSELYALLGAPDADEHDPTDRRRGRLVLYDALPANGDFRLDLDVLTPHFGEYYRETSPPADWLQPVPFTFLTVVETTFHIFFGLLPSADSAQTKRDSEHLNTITKVLGTALRDEGIGAKRSAGYGGLEVLNDTP